ncbi:uncharacterized protein LOC125676360 isoform X2 [Ostrea edulis]|uniref:uncharacterized protein LOC125676360 isoform X2 n=1 Tax=Ostrea edulis TaxID=37623 RepID=UPI0024AEB704|nr:uncharacterized protein LOC125676360 isoform X2 [Ostrea edulis]
MCQCKYGILHLKLLVEINTFYGSQYEQTSRKLDYFSFSGHCKEDNTINMELRRTVLLLLPIVLCCGYENLSKDLTAVQSTTWSCPAKDPTCTTYLPSNAVDGDISTCMRTEWIGSMSQYKTVWWYVNLGNIKSVYNIRIQFRTYEQQYEMRQRGRMAGFSLYVSNTSNIENGYLCYKDEPDLPPLDFSTTCVSHGRYVIFYNERQPGVQYPAGYELTSVTELCEVTVLGCMTTGRYGQKCDLICPSNCQKQRCHIVDGTCLGCIAGWIGNFCNKTCPNGYYGMECGSECRGHCRDGVSCNHTSGNCDNGCGDGWQGVQCDKTCEDGIYGPNCIYKCSGNCLNNVPCDKTTGKCQSCKPGYTGNLCNNSCPERFYGQNCSTACNGYCLNEECYHETGWCNDGCKEGYQGPFCNESCHQGFYGGNCSEKCSINCINNSCHHVEGYCNDGCNAGWIGSNCSQVCSTGRYGVNCSASCSSYCLADACDHVTGVCVSGCEDGYKGQLCRERCDYSWYGKNCSMECNTNCVNESCHHITGKCQHGCRPGWIGSNCSQACDKGLYGPNCSETCSEFCKADTDCNHVDGNCSNGCRSGYTGSKCDRICDDKWYGENCSIRCGKNCENQTCDHIYGECTYGCIPGWMETNCSQECLEGFYGQNCSNTCSSCLDNKCDAVDGVCDNGCDDGYTGQRCDEPCESGVFGRNCSEKCNENCKDQSCDHRYGNCTHGCAVGWMGFNCSTECTNGWYGEDCIEACSGNCADNTTCNRFNGTCSNGCETSFNGEKCDKNIVSDNKFVGSNADGDTTDSGVLAGSLSTVFTLTLIILTIVVIILRRKRDIKRKKSEEGEHFSTKLNSNGEVYKFHQDYEEIEINGLDNPVRETPAISPKTITVMDLQKKITFMSANGNALFKEEYSKVPKGELHPCNEAKKSENTSKNRYTTTFPYDHSRVVLKTASPTESDYINANFIQNAQGKRTYIATQGPKTKTITDFWRMVWQERVTIIVCLTNIKEGAKTKCALYWPSANDKIQNGDINVRHQEENIYANHTVRQFRIQSISEKSERDVYMFHYTQWPDHGVPNPLSIVLFHRQVMTKSEQCSGKYTLVHCSAGIGRTGTYIALDVLYKKFEKTGEINVQEYLEIMRNDRMNMIQGNDQYRIVYMALLESLRGKSRAIKEERFLQEYQEHSCYMNLGEVANKSPLSKEYEELLSLKKNYTDDDYEHGLQNKGANLTPNVLPVDAYMCEGTYYNAIYVQSSLWLPTKNEDKTIGEFVTKFSECVRMTNIIKTSIVLHSKKGSDIRLSVLECTKRLGENDTNSRRVLIDLIKEAKMEEKTYPDAKILLLSSDGARRCGSFCVVYNALEQLTMDKEVDIFTLTRLIQIRRPEFISNLEEYQFCYDAVADFLQNDMVYANA